MQRGIKLTLICGSECLHSITKTPSLRGLTTSTIKEETDRAGVSDSRRETESQRAGVTLTASEGNDHIDTEAAVYLFKFRRSV